MEEFCVGDRVVNENNPGLGVGRIDYTFDDGYCKVVFDKPDKDKCSCRHCNHMCENGSGACTWNLNPKYISRLDKEELMPGDFQSIYCVKV